MPGAFTTGTRTVRYCDRSKAGRSGSSWLHPALITEAKPPPRQVEKGGRSGRGRGKRRGKRKGRAKGRKREGEGKRERETGRGRGRELTCWNDASTRLEGNMFL